MSEEDLGIRAYIEAKIEAIDEKHAEHLKQVEEKYVTQRRYFVGGIIALVVAILSLIYSQVMNVATTKQIATDNKERIDLTNDAIETLTTNVNAMRASTVDIWTYNQYNATRDMEMRAFIAVCDGDTRQLEKVMEEFRDFRRDLMIRKFPQETLRGIDMTPGK